MTEKKTVYIFGEVLFDHFPDGSRVLGGAPFNVAWHLQAFGQAPRLVSKVGRDPEGNEVRAAMEDWGLATSDLQTDTQRPTGRVAVSFAEGEPAYDIVADCAYDHIDPVAATACQLLYHGSLAARAASSAGALQQLRASEPETIFVDVNLRPPWWQPAAIDKLLRGAHWVKLNSDELALLAGSATSADPTGDFLRRYNLRGLLVTRGARGAELLMATGERLQVAPAANKEVVDTVGAGDAFAAVMLLGLLHNWPMPLVLERAQQFAGALVGRRGATVTDRAFYGEFSREWQLTD
jgi:fructokinase